MKRTTIATALLAVVFLLASPLISPIKADIVEDNGNRLVTGPYILFPVNTTYTTRTVTLNLSFSTKLFSNIPLSAAYSLDGKPNVYVPLESSPSLIWNKNRVEGSVTLPELSDGPHTISVYATARMSIGFSYWDSETVYFTVETTPPSPNSTASPSPSPSSTSSTTTLQPTVNTGAEQANADSYVTSILVAVILSIVLSGVALLVYFKKRKRAAV